MSNENNNLAIILTEKIIKDLVRARMFRGTVCYDSKSDNVTEVVDNIPNFYQVRETILTTLNKYIDTLYLDFSYDTATLDMMKPEHRKDFLESRLKEEAYSVVEKIIDSDEHFNKFYLGDRYTFSERKYIQVLKTGLIAKTERGL